MKRTRSPKNTISACVPGPLEEAIRREAQRRDRTVSYVIGEILADHFGMTTLLKKWQKGK